MKKLPVILLFIIPCILFLVLRAVCFGDQIIEGSINGDSPALYCEPFDPDNPENDLIAIDDDGAGYPYPRLNTIPLGPLLTYADPNTRMGIIRISFFGFVCGNISLCNQ